MRTDPTARDRGMIGAMPFDFDAAVGAPFRMQPGLRRIAPGTQQLTPNIAPERGTAVHLREKLAVFQTYPWQALLAQPGFDAAPALDALARHAAREQPQAFALDAGAWVAPILGWAIDAAGELRELELALLVVAVGLGVQALRRGVVADRVGALREVGRRALGEDHRVLRDDQRASVVVDAARRTAARLPAHDRAGQDGQDRRIRDGGVADVDRLLQADRAGVRHATPDGVGRDVGHQAVGRVADDGAAGCLRLRLQRNSAHSHERKRRSSHAHTEMSAHR